MVTDKTLRTIDFYLIDANHSGPFEEPAPEGTVEVAVHELRQIRAALADSADAPCETCGGTGELEHVDPRRLTLEGDHPVEEVSPCPDCASADAPEGPFPSDYIEAAVDACQHAAMEDGRSIPPHAWSLDYGQIQRDALDRLDAQQKEER